MLRLNNNRCRFNASLKGIMYFIEHLIYNYKKEMCSKESFIWGGVYGI